MLKYSLHSLSQRFLGLAIVLMPFNALPYFQSILREMSNEGPFYPLCIAMLIWVLLTSKRIKTEFPKNLSVQILFAFLAWIPISAIFNLSSISVVETKGRSGIEKFFFQIILLSFVILCSFMVYNIASRMNNPLSKLKKYVLWSFAIAGTYSLIEIPFLAGNGIAKSILVFFNQFLRGEFDPMFEAGRLRSVSGEASWFAMYCSFIMPFIFSYIFTESKKKFWFYLGLSAYLLLLIILTKSRAAYFITALQLSLFLLGLFFAKKKSLSKKRLFLFAGGIGLAIAVTLIAFQKSILDKVSVTNIFSSIGESDNLSNIARFGSQTTAFLIAGDHYLFGVGLGQYGFYMPAYVPAWALISGEIQMWMSSEVDTPWAPVHGVYARIASELGYVGLGIWLLMWASVIWGCFRRYRSNNQLTGKHDTLGLALIISIIGALMSGMNSDSFRFFGYWISLGLAWSYMKTVPSPDQMRLPIYLPPNTPLKKVLVAK